MTILVIAFVLALLAGIFVRWYLIQQMSNVRPAAAAGVYLKQDSIDIQKQDDTFLYLTVQRVPKPKAEEQPANDLDDNDSSFDFNPFDDDDDDNDDNF